MTQLETIDGYTPSQAEIDRHAKHISTEDRWDDCPLCWADVISSRQRDWLMELGQGGFGNSIAATMGLQPKSS